MAALVQPFRLDRIPDNLLREPLDYLMADHVRQRKVCDALGILITGAARDDTQDMAEAIVAYLSGDFLLHVQDEEIDLFPCLRGAAADSGEEVASLEGLKCDHAADLALAKGLVADLRQMATSGGTRTSPGFIRVAVAFTATERRHLALEDQVILPLARRRLSAADLDRIGHAMAARRNIDFPLQSDIVP
jgi:hemerythrin-like domain-containing protein